MMVCVLNSLILYINIHDHNAQHISHNMRLLFFGRWFQTQANSKRVMQFGHFRKTVSILQEYDHI